jgi:hypothetical protein
MAFDGWNQLREDFLEALREMESRGYDQPFETVVPGPDGAMLGLEFYRYGDQYGGRLTVQFASGESLAARFVIESLERKPESVH